MVTAGSYQADVAWRLSGAPGSRLDPFQPLTQGVYSPELRAYQRLVLGSPIEVGLDGSRGIRIHTSDWAAASGHVDLWEVVDLHEWTCFQLHASSLPPPTTQDVLIPMWAWTIYLRDGTVHQGGVLEQLAGYVPKRVETHGAQRIPGATAANLIPLARRDERGLVVTILAHPKGWPEAPLVAAVSQVQEQLRAQGVEAEIWTAKAAWEKHCQSKGIHNPDGRVPGWVWATYQQAVPYTFGLCIVPVTRGGVGSATGRILRKALDFGHPLVLDQGRLLPLQGVRRVKGGWELNYQEAP